MFLKPKTFEEQMLDPQRAVRHVPLEPKNVALALLLALVADSLLLLGAQRIFDLWRRICEGILAVTGAEGKVLMERWILGPRSGVVSPWVDLVALSPDPRQWWWTAYASFVTWIGVGYLPDRFMPATYAIRFLCAVQATSLLVFWWKPASYVYGISHFTQTELNIGFAFMLLQPLMLGLSYLLLNFKLRHKLFLLAGTLAYFVFAVPVHIMLCSLLAHWLSLLTLPMFYLAFGPLVFVAWFVAFYSWGMGWNPSGGPGWAKEGGRP